MSFESGKSDECGCIPEIVHADSTNFIQEDIDKCGRPCSGDASQLCGGRADASGSDTRYASIYKVVTNRPIGQQGSVATLPCQVGYSATATQHPDGAMAQWPINVRLPHYLTDPMTQCPNAPMQVGIFEPQFDSTGVFPSKGLAGDTVCMLVRGVDQAKGDKASLTMCGKPCGTVADATQEAFLAAWNAGGLLPNGQADPDAPAWITEVPFGVYDAQPLFCAAPDCPAGSNAPMHQCPNAPMPLMPQCPNAPMPLMPQCPHMPPYAPNALSTPMSPCSNAPMPQYAPAP